MKKKLVFLRRKGLGAGSIKGMVRYIEKISYDPSAISFIGNKTTVVRNDRFTSTLQESELSSCLLVRWGCTSETGVSLENQVNTSNAISEVNDKKSFRMMLQASGLGLVPESIDTLSTTITGPMVLRPRAHAQGRNLFVVEGMGGLRQVLSGPMSAKFRGGWYASELIDKEAEYRVYVVNGRVATVARKTPADPSAVAWNVAQGGRFDVVGWGEWPLEAVRVAVEAFKLSQAHFLGVDVMIDRQGKAYVIEANSAPSLPALSDGSVSYRQTCMAKCFEYMAEHGTERLEVDNYMGWRGVIHPAVRSST